LLKVWQEYWDVLDTTEDPFAGGVPSKSTIKYMNVRDGYEWCLAKWALFRRLIKLA
jgi:hypothetical protein